MRALLLVIGLVVSGVAVQATAATVLPAPAPAPRHTMEVATAAKPTEANRGRVFLLRGLANVFSLGMDKLAGKLRAKNLPARVTNYSHWRPFSDLLIDEYRSGAPVLPIIIIGHSLGADAAVNMGNYLASKGVPVRLVVAFDGVANSGPVVAGVAEVVNYYKGDALGHDIKGAAGFKGKLINVDLADNKDIDHLNIEKSPTLQNEVVAKVAAIFAQR